MKSKKSYLKRFGIPFALLTALNLSGAYLGLAYQGGFFNPFSSESRAKLGQRLSEKRIVEEKLYSKRYNQLFGQNGLADTDGNGIVDFLEGLDVYKRLQKERSFGTLDVTRELNLNQLETVIESYKNK